MQPTAHNPHLDPASTPDAIEQRSFAIIDAEIPEPRPFTGNAWHIARRMIHTTGDISILPHICLDEAAVYAGITALRAGCRIFTDTEMARCGMVARRLDPLSVQVQCMLTDTRVAAYAEAQHCTRAKAGVLLHKEHMHGNIVAIGNAPTALLTLLDVLNKGTPPPALIIGMPVGFVNAAESKDMLAQSPYPHMTLLGRKGGSPLVAAVVNALAILACELSIP